MVDVWCIGATPQLTSYTSDGRPDAQKGRFQASYYGHETGSSEAGRRTNGAELRRRDTNTGKVTYLHSASLPHQVQERLSAIRVDIASTARVRCGEIFNLIVKA